MKCTDLLMEEHKIIRRGLDVVDHMADRVEHDQPVPAEDITTILRFLRVFADDHHQGKEESALFPELRRTSAGNQERLRHMTFEHDQERSNTLRKLLQIKTEMQGTARAPMRQEAKEEAMIHIKKIMVPVDFSEPSKKAVNYGLSLALEFEARLILANIVPYDSLAYLTAKARLLELIPAELRERMDFELIVKSGDVRQELLGIVEEKEIHLVVMGSRGRSYVERLLLGSVTERMLRKLHVPILTVSHLDPERELHKPGPVPLKKLLYATDLVDGSEPGLEFSIRLARGLNAHLTVVHVVQPLDAAMYGLDAAGYVPDYAAEARAQASERLNRSDGSVPITTVLADGVAYERINALAAEHKADLVVMNLQGKGRLDRALLGTTAERVIRTAAVPVLSLPLPATYKDRWAAA